MTDREKLIELITDAMAPKDKLALYGAASRLVDHLIANGVTIPVRCKDCKHYDGQECYHPRSEIGEVLDIDPPDFCSYGERRGNET